MMIFWKWSRDNPDRSLKPTSKNAARCLFSTLLSVHLRWNQYFASLIDRMELIIALQ